MPKYYYFIVNPKSGSSKDFTAIKQLRHHLRQRGDTVRVELTKSLEHAGELATQARNDQCDTVIVSGGDGTVRVVAEAMAGSELPIMVIPSGTENLMATEIGLVGSFKHTLHTLDHGMTRKLDLGLANHQYFMAIAGVGFDAEVIHRIIQFRSGHITHTDYLWPICRTFWEHKFPHMHIEADGQLLCDEPALVFVSNISRYAVGLGISKQADFSDGLLDLCIYKCHQRRTLLQHSLLTVLNLSHLSSRIVRQRHRHIKITSPDPNVFVQIDGDPGPAMPLEINVMPAAARVLTPPPPGHPEHIPQVKFANLKRILMR